MKQNKWILLGLLTFLFIGNQAMADTITITKVLGNFSEVWKEGRILAAMFCYVGGAATLMIGLQKATRVSIGKEEPWNVFFYILTAALLVSLPSIIDAITNQMGLEGRYENLDKQNSMFLKKDVAKKNENSFYIQGGQAFQSIIGLIQLVGIVAVIRGILLMKRMGKTQQQDGMGFGRVLLFIIPGTALINIVSVATIFAKTAGLGEGLIMAAKAMGG